MPPTFFTLTAFLLPFCQVLRFWIIVPRVLRIWESFFQPWAFFTLPSFLTFAIASRVLRIWERFFYSQVFLTIHSFSKFNRRTCCTNLPSRDPWEPAVLPWSCRASQLWFETQTRSMCLFDSHSFQQKLLLCRFCLCVKVPRNTISTSSRFWTHSLIATCTVTCMSYALGGISS